MAGIRVWLLAVLSMVLVGCGESGALPQAPVEGTVIFDNGTWRVSSSTDAVAATDFELAVDGTAADRSTAIRIDHGQGAACRLNVEGVLRCKAGEPSLPFGQGIILGPTLVARSASFPSDALFSAPEITRVNVDSSGLDASGAGSLILDVQADPLIGALPAAERRTNDVMALAWTLSLTPNGSNLAVSVDTRFSFIESVTLTQSAVDAAEAFRVSSLRSMFLDTVTHDVDEAAFNRDGDSRLVIDLADAPVDTLLPATPVPLATTLGEVQLRQTDDTGMPNGDTPWVALRNLAAVGDIFAADAFPRLRVNASTDVSGDNVELFVTQATTRTTFDAGDSGSIAFDVLVGHGPIPFADGSTSGPSFSADIQPIFTNNCALSGCHAPPAPQRGLDLSAGSAYTAIVDVDAEEVMLKRIAPGNPDDSYLIRKLEGGPDIVGAQMPFGAPPLAAGLIQQIRDWTAAGAIDN